MTEIYIGDKWSEVKPSGHYVYVHFRASNGEPFYVGLGQNDRAWHKTPDHRSAWWMRTARKHGFKLSICQEGMTRENAILLEMWLIAKLRHEGCNLVNMTDGGDGAIGGPGSGHKPVVCSNGNRFSSISDAVKWVSDNYDEPLACTSAISAAASGALHSAYGFAWWYEGDAPKEYIHNRERSALSNKRAVKSSDGHEFDSASDAAEWMKVNGWPKASKGNICRAIRNGGSCYGQAWWYAWDDEREYVDPNTKKTEAKQKKIQRGDGIIYPSATIAVENLVKQGHAKANKSALTRASKDQNRTAYGYTWKYI